MHLNTPCPMTFQASLSYHYIKILRIKFTKNWTRFFIQILGVWGLETSLLISGFLVPFPVLLLLWLPIFFIPNNSLLQQSLFVFSLRPKKYQKITRMYDRTGLSTKCTLIKTGFKNLRTSTEAKIRPFVDTLMCVSILKNQKKKLKLIQ